MVRECGRGGGVRKRMERKRAQRGLESVGEGRGGSERELEERELRDG
jgi:hypothetical protein